MNKLELTQIGTSSLIIIITLLSGNRDWIANMTLLFGSLLVLVIGLIGLIDVPSISEKYGYPLDIINLIGVLLPILGMFFGNFSAPFTIGIPFGFYFILAFIISVQFVSEIYLLVNSNVEQ